MISNFASVGSLHESIYLVCVFVCILSIFNRLTFSCLQHGRLGCQADAL
jgi:hypothetical protein